MMKCSGISRNGCTVLGMCLSPRGALSVVNVVSYVNSASLSQAHTCLSRGSCDWASLRKYLVGALGKDLWSYRPEERL